MIVGIMEQLVNEIRPGYADGIINEKLATLGPSTEIPFTFHFNSGEEFFIRLAQPIVVPSFPIHHDVRQSTPSVEYATALRDFIDHLLPAVPPFFSDLTYFFDPSEIQKPCFYRIYKIEDSYYLYLIRINLLYRPLESEELRRGSNDTTAAYRSNRLYLESDVIPLVSVITELGKIIAFTIRQTISQTWIGETGKGYLVRGIWMDMELTKFFSKLFLPPGKRTYPYYPFTCKYKTLCLSILDPRPEKRRTQIPLLHGALGFLLPDMEKIQQALTTESFSENLPLFKEIRARVPPSLVTPWTNITVTPYLNENEQKEFRIDV